MAYTYDDFKNAATSAGMMNRFSKHDLDTATRSPEYGLSLLGLFQDEAKADTAEKRLLATEAANQLRKNYGVYATGDRKNGYAYAGSYGGPYSDPTSGPYSDPTGGTDPTGSDDEPKKEVPPEVVAAVKTAYNKLRNTAAGSKMTAVEIWNALASEFGLDALNAAGFYGASAGTAPKHVTGVRQPEADWRI